MSQAPHSLFSEATDAGLLGGSAVALWFLARDLVAGRPLVTPSVLGQVFLFGADHPDAASPVFGAVMLYTGAHFIAFLLFGAAAALLVRLSVDQPVFCFAVVMLFVVFEFAFYVVVSSFSPDVAALFPLWTVLGANLLAGVVMGAYFWRRNLELRQALGEQPLGA